MIIMRLLSRETADTVAQTTGITSAEHIKSHPSPQHQHLPIPQPAAYRESLSRWHDLSQQTEFVHRYAQLA